MYDNMLMTESTVGR